MRYNPRSPHFKLAKKSECSPHPSLRQLLPILQKLEFRAGFHVPNDIVPGFGQEKKERREYPPPFKYICILLC